MPKTRRLPVHHPRRPDGTFESRPFFVVWEVTHRCDQACRFCGTRAGRPLDDELTTAEALDVVAQLAAMGTREVAIHGGEAYMRPDWLEIVRAIAGAGMACTMVTGGRRFTRERAREVAAAGITSVSLSVDGTEATHDELRGLTGSHASAIAAIEALLEAGVAVGCNTQLNQRNFRELLEITEILGRFELYGWQVQLMVPMGRAADAEDLWLQPYDLLEVIPLIARARVRADELGIPLWPGNNVGYFGPHEDTLRRGRSRRGYAGGCGGGVVCMGVEANGSIKGCSAMMSEGYVGGNVRGRPIRETWELAKELRIMRDFDVEQLWGPCRECYYAEICKGGCVWTASTLLGRHGNNPYCHHRALEHLAAGKRERLVRRGAASGLKRDKATFELVVEEAPGVWVAARRAQIT